MNRPEKRNAMNPQMHYEMDRALPDIEADPEVRAVVLTGAGEAYCAGQILTLIRIEMRITTRKIGRRSS